MLERITNVDELNIIPSALVMIITLWEKNKQITTIEIAVEMKMENYH